MTPGIKRWTEKENKLLSLAISYGMTIPEICKIFPNRTKESISYRVRHFKKGITWEIKWTNEKINFLKENCTKISLKEISNIIGMKYKSVHAKAKELKLTTVLGKKEWTFAETLFIFDNYNELSISDISNILGFCQTTIENKLKRFKISKFIPVGTDQYQALFNDNPFLSKEDIENIRASQSKIISDYLNSKSEKSTSIELKIKQILDAASIEYISQYKISQFIADFYIPSANLIVEADGDYWHCNPKKYPNGPINESQALAIIKDKRRDEFLLSKGYNILRFWESDINDDLESVHLTILDFIDKNNKARQDGDILDESRN